MNTIQYHIFWATKALVTEKTVKNSTASYNPKLYQYDVKRFSTASDNLK